MISLRQASARLTAGLSSHCSSRRTVGTGRTACGMQGVFSSSTSARPTSGCPSAERCSTRRRARQAHPLQTRFTSSTDPRLVAAVGRHRIRPMRSTRAFSAHVVVAASLTSPSQNTWSALRIVNATADLAYIEFRPHASPLARASTNWTELYDLRADPWQAVNLCVRKWWGLWDNAGAARPMIAALLPLRVPHSQQGATHDPRRARPIE